MSANDQPGMNLELRCKMSAHGSSLNTSLNMCLYAAACGARSHGVFSTTRIAPRHPPATRVDSKKLELSIHVFDGFAICSSTKNCHEGRGEPMCRPRKAKPELERRGLRIRALCRVSARTTFATARQTCSPPCEPMMPCNRPPRAHQQRQERRVQRHPRRYHREPSSQNL